MFIDFPQALIASVIGRDAERYLNARLSNHTKALQPGEWIDSAALSPQGKIEGIYQIRRISKEEYLLICDGGDHAELITALKRYIVADRLEVKDLSEENILIHCLGDLAMDVAVLAQRRHSRTGQTGIDLVAPKQAWESYLKSNSLQKMPRSQYEFLRIAHGNYAYPQELSGISISEIDYSKLVSFKKGCYVGQELVEKVDSFAKSPKVLARILVNSTQEIPEQTEIFANNQKIGQVLRQFRSDGYKNSFVVARIRNDQVLAGADVTIDSATGKLFLRQEDSINV